MRRSVVCLSCVAVVAALTGCEQETTPYVADRSAENIPLPGSPPRPAQQQAPTQPMPQANPVGGERPDGPAQQPEDPTVAEFLGLRGPKPATWLWQPPQNQMVHTNYTVPGIDGGRPAYITIFYFGQGQGGSVQANIDRWKNQFRTPEGYEPQPKVSELTVNGMAVTLVELAGEYMQMGAGWYTPDQLFLAAIIDAPVGRVFIRFVGPTATVENNREAFNTLIHNLEVIDQG